MDTLEICCMSVVEMADAIRTRRLSPVEIMDAVLHRIEELNPTVNAYCTLVAESAREQAIDAEAAVMGGEELGPLHGVPVSIKDLIFTKGIRTTLGSRMYENDIPQQDAIVVERLKAAGAIITGKTNTSEFGWVAVTDGPLLGATRNPWNLELSSGGSSGGAAASVALCMGSLAIGSDGGGSIRVPSSFCGVFGFKPSFGRVPQYPMFPEWEDLAHTGPITRCEPALPIFPIRWPKVFPSIGGSSAKAIPPMESARMLTTDTAMISSLNLLLTFISPFFSV